MLSNRKIAWLITAMMMITGLFLGSYISYRQMRAPIVDVFRSEVEPILNEKMQLVHNMLTLYRLHAPDNDETRDFIRRVMWNIEYMQDEMELVRWISTASWIIMQNAAELDQRGQALDMSESDAMLMRNLYIDMQEIEMILSQSPYNNMALAFNVATMDGLGVLTHNRVTERIFGNDGKLPLFLY